jgi:hypothetical protein
LIVCEGAETEPRYFRGFKVVVGDNIRGFGLAPMQLVAKAKEIAHKEGPFDQVWCVFDKDDIPADDFDNAIQSAESVGHRVAYSNEAFELWFCLHFNYLDTPISRNQYLSRLTDLLNTPYSKTDSEMYRRLESRQDDAIWNAERLEQQHLADTPPSQRCPITKVHHLVSALRTMKR